MRTLTNRYGLPGAIVEAVKNDDYTPGESDITATGLIKPPQLKELERRHEDEIVEDVSERLWALMGKAVHTLLETSEPSAITETRLYITVDPASGRMEPGARAFPGGVTVGGQFDRMTLRQVTLQDYKFASVWELINGLKADREQQLNILAELAFQNGYDQIRNLEIVHLARDWSLTKSYGNSNYPPVPMNRIRVPLWERMDRVAFIRQRVAIHSLARELPDGSLPLCSNEDRWKDPPTYAVMKEGRKSAVKLHDTRETAEAQIAELGGKHYLQERGSEPKRCQRYCPVADFCRQYQAELSDQASGQIPEASPPLETEVSA